MTLPMGVIKRVAILFPEGCAGLVHVQIYHNEQQVWPTTPGASFLGNGTYHSFEESYDLPEAWNAVRVVGWNDDDTFSHTVNIWLGEFPQEEKWGILSLLSMPRYGAV